MSKRPAIAVFGEAEGSSAAQTKHSEGQIKNSRGGPLEASEDASLADLLKEIRDIREMTYLQMARLNSKMEKSSFQMDRLKDMMGTNPFLMDRLKG